MANPVTEILEHVNAQVAAMSTTELGAITGILDAAEVELTKDLAKWAALGKGADKFTAQMYRNALIQIRGTLTHIRGELQEDLASALRHGGAVAGNLATKHLTHEVQAFSGMFEHSVRPIAFEAANVLAQGKKTLWPKFANSAKRYAGQVGEDIKRQLAIGVVRGETLDQLTTRLAKLGGPKGLVYTRGAPGTPGAKAEMIAEGLFTRYRHYAERLAVTELVNAYNVTALHGMDELEENDPGYYRKWDAAIDKRTCDYCARYDDLVVKLNERFPGGIDHPPLHPRCRCAVVVWRKEWTEHSYKDDLVKESIKGKEPRGVAAVPHLVTVQDEKKLTPEIIKEVKGEKKPKLKQQAPEPEMTIAPYYPDGKENTAYQQFVYKADSGYLDTKGKMMGATINVSPYGAGKGNLYEKQDPNKAWKVMGHVTKDGDTWGAINHANIAYFKTKEEATDWSKQWLQKKHEDLINTKGATKAPAGFTYQTKIQAVVKSHGPAVDIKESEWKLDQYSTDPKLKKYLEGPSGSTMMIKDNGNGTFTAQGKSAKTPVHFKSALEAEVYAKGVITSTEAKKAAKKGAAKKEETQQEKKEEAKKVDELVTVKKASKPVKGEKIPKAPTGPVPQANPNLKPRPETEAFGPDRQAKHERDIEKFTDKLDSAEYKSLKKYAGDEYSFINDNLRKPDLYVKMTDKEKEKHKDLLEDIDSGLKKSHAPEDMLVYRATKINLAKMAGLKPGMIFEDRGYVSTSVNHHVAGSKGAFGSKKGTVFHIEVPKGHTLAPIPTGLSHEAEWLLPRGSRFEIISVENKSVVNTTGKIVRMRVVPND